MIIGVVEMGFPGGASGKEPAANAEDARDVGLIPGLGGYPGRQHGNTFQYSWWRISWIEEPGRLQSIR